MTEDYKQQLIDLAGDLRKMADEYGDEDPAAVGLRLQSDLIYKEFAPEKLIPDPKPEITPTMTVRETIEFRREEQAMGNIMNAMRKVTPSDNQLIPEEKPGIVNTFLKAFKI